MKILFLTCEDFIHGSNDDQDDDKILIRELTEANHHISVLPWSQAINWKDYELVIIRTTWDYMLTPEKFLTTLEMISRQTRLLNSFETVRWNIHKKYLIELEQKGIKIVPTKLFKHDGPLTIPGDWGHDKFVIKPAVSASAYKTMIVTRKEIETEAYRNALFPGDWMCQPFIPEISQGETSLLYFNKEFSHALLKVPRPGDFRVQVEWGGTVETILPTQELLKLGQKIMEAIPDELLYARIDVVPFEGSFALMELELIEPALYFRTCPEAASNFLKALNQLKKLR